MPILLLILLGLGAFAAYEASQKKTSGPSPQPQGGPQPIPPPGVVIPPGTSGSVPGVVPVIGPPSPTVGPSGGAPPTIYGDVPNFVTVPAQLTDGHTYNLDFRRSDLATVDPTLASSPDSTDPTFGGTLLENFLDAHAFQDGKTDYQSFGIVNSDPNYAIASFVAVGNTTLSPTLPYSLSDVTAGQMNTLPVAQGGQGGQTAATNPDAGGQVLPQGGQSYAAPGGGGAALPSGPAQTFGGTMPILSVWPSSEGGESVQSLHVGLPHGGAASRNTTSHIQARVERVRAVKTAGAVRNTSRAIWQGYAAPEDDEPR